MLLDIGGKWFATIKIPCGLIETILTMKGTSLNEQGNPNSFSIGNI